MTLIELMAAIIILGLIMMAMARTLITSLATVQTQERQVLASAVVSGVLEQAQGVPFRTAGLCQAAATAYFGGAGLNHQYTDPNPPNAVITEPMVLISNDDPYCNPGPPALVPSQVVTRRGVPYTVQTIVSWFDEPSDGLGAADTTGTQDMKHVVVTATWPVRGSTRSMTSETYLSPVAGEQPLVTRVVPQPAGSVAYTYLDPAGISASDVMLTARALDPQNIVKVRWLKRDGMSTGWIDMANTSGDRVTWNFLIQSGAAGNPYNSFPNGETIFEFEATDPANKKVATFNRGLFVHETPAITSLTTVPAVVTVDETGNVCPFELRMTGFGLLPTDVTDVVFTDGSPASRAFPSGTPRTPEADGSDFALAIAGETGFIPGVDEAVTVSVQRVNDSKTATRDIAIPVSETVVTSC